MITHRTVVVMAAEGATVTDPINYGRMNHAATKTTK